MASRPSDPYSRPAGVDLSSSKNRLGIIAADGDIELPSGQGVQCHGIIEEPVEAGRTTALRMNGPSKIELGETMAAGAPFTAFDASGVAGVAAAADHVQGFLILGGDAGDIVPCNVGYAGIL